MVCKQIAHQRTSFLTPPRKGRPVTPHPGVRGHRTTLSGGSQEGCPLVRNLLADHKLSLSPHSSKLLSMDTISRENNSLLPMGGVIIGAVAFIIGGYAAIELSKVNRTLAQMQDKVAKI